MEKYRKDDQYYVDEYDRRTILQLKKLENKELEELKGLSDMETWKKKLEHAMSYNGFHITGVCRARNKDRILMEQKMADERKDQLIQRNPAPQNIKCKDCGSQMQFEAHLFKGSDNELLFIFECPNRHLPKKAIRTDGSEYFFPIRKCDKCGGKLISKTEKKTDYHFKFIDICSSCGNIVIDEFELDPDEEKVIIEEDRKKYCAYFTTAKTFYEGLKAITDLAGSIELSNKQKKEKEELEVDKIEKPNIPQLEKQLATLAEEKGFVKFQFDKPEIDRHVIITFSLQDPSDRTEQESVKLITKSIKDTLFYTNWRLMSEGVSYRLGYLTGRLKSYEQDKDILKIAKEIKTYKARTKK